MKLCNRCETPFKPKVSYQIYCGDVCREESTKIKIAERYQITRRDMSYFNENYTFEAVAKNIDNVLLNKSE